MTNSSLKNSGMPGRPLGKFGRSMFFNNFYLGKRVLVTGHTGFKGSWLSEWLLMLGAEVAGYALDPKPHELLYDQLNLANRLALDVRDDISNLDAIKKLTKKFNPEIIIHMAAQPLVRLSYDEPVETFKTNVMGTVNVLEAVRECSQSCTIVCVTTDKCYENREWLYGYREVDAMGGYDPYSASKGAAEIAIASYRRSYFHANQNIRLASARAGNVIGGGDWAIDRIIPDCIRSFRSNKSVKVRNKVATRPWQHVLEPLSGYLNLAWMMSSERDKQRINDLSTAFNFGPNIMSNKTVLELVVELIKYTGGKWDDASDSKSAHEASKLNLAIDKAYHQLGWHPVMDFSATVKMTADWYTDEYADKDLIKLTQMQLKEYQEMALNSAVKWAVK